MQKTAELPTAALLIAVLLVAGVALGALFAVILIPDWLPVLVASIKGPSPKVYWYLSRASGLLAYFLIWITMVMGLLITGKVSRIWPGGYTAVDLHNYTGLVGLSFAVFHVVVLLGDQYLEYRVFHLLVPFASSPYRPLWVGLGQLGLYLGIIITLSFYVRKHIGPKTRRLIHYGSFAVFWLVTVHGVTAGTDATAAAVLAMYSIAGATTFFLVAYRILAAAKQSGMPSTEKRRRRDAANQPAAKHAD